MSAWIVPSRTASETSSTARTPPNPFETCVASSITPSASGTATHLDRRVRVERRVDVVGREALRGATPQGRFGRPEDAAREAEDARHEQRAEKDLPKRRDRRDDVLADHVEAGAEQRPPHRSAAAEDHHQHEVARLVPIELERLREVDQQPEERAREPRHRRGEQQRDEDEAIAVQAEIAHARLVLPDRDQRSPERRGHHRAERGEAENERGERHVVERRVGDRGVRRFERRPRDVHPVFAARHVGVAIGDEVEHLPERDREQAEIDPATAQQERAEHDGAGESGVRILHRERRAVRAEPEIRRVAERREPGIAEQQVHAHRRDRHEQHFADDRDVEPDQRREQRREQQHDQHRRRGGERGAPAHPKMPSSPKSPRGRISSTTAMSTYIDTSLAAGTKSVVMEMAMPISSPPTMLPNRLPIPPMMTVTNAGMSSAFPLVGESPSIPAANTPAIPARKIPSAKLTAYSTCVFVPSAAIISVSCTAARNRSPNRVRVSTSARATIATISTSTMKMRNVGKTMKPRPSAPLSAGGGANGTPFAPQISRYASSAISESPNVISKL